MNIRTILFDLGNVILPICVKETAADWSRVSGIPAGRILEKLDFEKGIFHDFEKGNVSPGKFRNSVMKLTGLKLPKKDFDRGWNRMIDDVYPDISDIIERLAGKYRLGLLSNTNSIHEKYFRKKYPAIFSRFDKIFLSHRVGERKPDEAFYRKALKGLHALPEETVFLDDRPEFTAAAECLGIHTVTVSGRADITDGLKKLGVLF